MEAQSRKVSVLHVKHGSSDEMAVLVRETAAVLTLRNVKLFMHAGDSCGPDTGTTNTRGATRMDIFDIKPDAVFLVSDFGVWNVNTSVLDGATLVAQQETETSCTGAGGDAGAKRGHGNEDGRPQAPRRRQRTSMV